LNVSFLAPNIASIRYEKTIRANDAATRSIWLATVTFRYSNAPMSEDDRLVNPIGFEVTDYRNDPEVGG
ncbi:type IV secretion system protein, partial [Mesorhizobium sp. M7A.T.Ca.US.000.02.1.1]